jgi:hypothetical protein
MATRKATKRTARKTSTHHAPFPGPKTETRGDSPTAEVAAPSDKVTETTSKKDAKEKVDTRPILTPAVLEQVTRSCSKETVAEFVKHFREDA